ncbi:protein of unknown function [Cohnella sp. OV330]|uniref:ImmA/IrrE family metallo-endopeptidase n=1 Tax=Cohnella sp. OV330 TaxID=1855288 RepID=UPI0008E82B72|nr:ImmA/IrrE family metallo-endopeptidase [Cohnella sp. OV330]SFB62742.1 protein of unknown function [Cohnella sp. OV330]
MIPFPRLLHPRFTLAARSAQAVLRELGNPEPPINIEPYLKKMKWRLKYEELHGPDGYMIKLVKGGKVRYTIYLATDSDPDSPYDVETIQKRQFFTAVHELGHILLHGNFLLNSHESMNAIPEELAGILEVEAHWFASKLLMPNYVFRQPSDLIPEILAKKCGVNITPAIKRLSKLDNNIRESLTTSFRLDKYEKLPTWIDDPHSIYCASLKWDSIHQALNASKRRRYICPKCGLFHGDHNIWGPYCIECEEPVRLVKFPQERYYFFT